MGLFLYLHRCLRGRSLPTPRTPRLVCFHSFGASAVPAGAYWCLLVSADGRWWPLACQCWVCWCLRIPNGCLMLGDPPAASSRISGRFSSMYWDVPSTNS